jgi:hypothetical protein
MRGLNQEILERIPSNFQKPNAFLDINGIPYLLGEYLDRNQFRQVDRSLIRSEININNSEAMRTVVDVKIDDIGKRSDGYLNIIGNRSKQRSLLKKAVMNVDRLNRRFDVIRKGLIIRVNYRLENERTKQVIRSAIEEFRILDRNYYIDINPRDINDNGLIINFNNSIVSTIDQFTHGTDRMIIRIISIQLFYECLQRDQIRSEYENNTFYYHHKKTQSRHFLDINGRSNFTDNQDEIYPDNWKGFNKFYRFDNNGRSIILHNDEINDANNTVFMVPCGIININRVFLINPGHRIVFKFSIWKNDLVLVNNTTKLAQVLGIEYDKSYSHPPHYPTNTDIGTLIYYFNNNQRKIKNLERLIKQLLNNNKNGIDINSIISKIFDEKDDKAEKKLNTKRDKDIYYQLDSIFDENEDG